MSTSYSDAYIAAQDAPYVASLEGSARWGAAIEADRWRDLAPLYAAIAAACAPGLGDRLVAARAAAEEIWLHRADTVYSVSAGFVTSDEATLDACWAAAAEASDALEACLRTAAGASAARLWWQERRRRS